MPTAQWGYPGVPGSDRSFVYPADFICEAIDQTRGWFYSLLAVNTLVRGTTPYRNVLCLGHIVDADGRKMSKSVGNVIDPWEILDHPGRRPAAVVDVLAGIAVDAHPGQLRGDRRLDPRRAAHPVEHVVVLHHLRHAQRVRPGRPGGARAGGPARSSTAGCCPGCTPPSPRSPTRSTATSRSRRPPRSAELIDDMSNWYVRRSRRRFWRTDPGADPADSLGAQATLHEVLVTVARLLAPMTPVPGRPDVARPDRGRRVGLGPPGRLAGGRRAAGRRRPSRRAWPWPGGCPRSAGPPGPRPGSRSASRWPGPWSYLPPGSPAPPPGVVEDELNVDRVEVTDELGDVLTYELVPNFKLLGPRLGKRVQDLRAAMASVRRRRRGRRPGRGHGRWWSSWPTDRSSWPPTRSSCGCGPSPGSPCRATAPRCSPSTSPSTTTCAAAGWPASVVRNVQDLRKATGLEVSDTIRAPPGRPRRPGAAVRRDRPRGAGRRGRRPGPRPTAATGTVDRAGRRWTVRTATIWVRKA